MSDRIVSSSSTSPILTGPTLRYDKRNGNTTEYVFEGAEVECKVKARQLIAQKADNVMVGPAGNGNWKVEAQFSGSELEEGGPDADQPTNLHELENTVEQVHWNKSARCRSFFNTSAQRCENIITAVAKHVTSYQNGQTEKNIESLTFYANEQANLTIELNKISGITPTEIADAKKLMGHILFYGFETFYNYNSVYSRTITAATYAQVRAAYTGVGQVWTSAEVVAQEGLPESEWFGLDASVLWLKSPPRVSAASGGKTQISYNYVSAPSFSKFQASAYGAASLVD